MQSHKKSKLPFLGITNFDVITNIKLFVNPIISQIGNTLETIALKIFDAERDPLIYESW